MTEKKKLTMEDGSLVWRMPDGTKRPLTRDEIKRLKTQIGQSNSAKKRKQNNER